MAPLTDSRPKPLIDVAGRSLLDHALAPAEHFGADPIVVNTHYRAAMIADALEGRGVRVSHEETLLDTGGGLKHALPILGPGPVFTMNSDAVWHGPNPYEVLERGWAAAPGGALLLCVTAEGARGRQGAGDFTLAPDGTLSRGGPIIYTGAQIIMTDLVADRADDVFSLNIIWNDMLERGQLRGVLYPGIWCDVGRPENIAIAEAELNAVS
ncbi:MAG: nucleotidyltransferase family protein [Shimia sp.]